MMNVVNMNDGFKIGTIHIHPYYFFIACTILLTGWIIPKSFVLAGKENFFLIVMIGNIVLSIGGLLGSHYVFHAPITITHMVGCVVALVGIALLTL
jgi:hypothetical protein